MGLKKLVKAAGKIITGAGGILAGKKGEELLRDHPELYNALAGLHPATQFLKSITRPTITLSLVFTLILGIVIQWIQQLTGVPTVECIVIPKYLVSFNKIVVSAYIGSRGLEKIIGKII